MTRNFDNIVDGHHGRHFENLFLLKIYFETSEQKGPLTETW